MNNCSFNAGATSPEFMAVRTPAAKDRSRVLKKQKIVFDEDRVIPGKYVMLKIMNVFKHGTMLSF